jgi:hypothetical protein
MLVHSCNLIQFEACFLPVFDITKSVSEQKMKLKVFVANQSFLSTFDNIFHMMSTMHYYLFFHISDYLILLIARFQQWKRVRIEGSNTKYHLRHQSHNLCLDSSEFAAIGQISATPCDNDNSAQKWTLAMGSMS